MTAKHCRCTSRTCQKRFKGVPGVTKCPACDRVGRLDTWAARKPWRLNIFYCDAYHYPHRHHGGRCEGARVWPELPGIDLAF